jgi:hypothetical protein
MKKKITMLFVLLLLLLYPLFISGLFADQPPDPGGGPGGGDDPVGGGSPLGSGLIFMLGMAVTYGMSKVNKIKKR